MRFGRHLHRNRVPEWTPFYIDYYGLKRSIKLATRNALVREHGEVNLTAFFSLFDSEIAKVDKYYLTTYRNLEDVYGGPGSDTFDSSLGLDFHEHVAVLHSCVQHSVKLRQLRWYGKVNADGFKFLLRKLKRIQPDSASAAVELSSYEFVHQQASLRKLEHLDATISVLKSEDFLNRNASLRLERLGGVRDVESLVQMLSREEYKKLETVLQSLAFPNSLLHATLQHAALQQSRKCMQMLLSRLDTYIQEDGFRTSRNILHTQVLSAVYREELCNGRGSRERYGAVIAAYEKHGCDDTSMLLLTLRCLSPGQRRALTQKDYRGRLPLHYAAEAGLYEICVTLLEFMDEWNVLEPQNRDDPSTCSLVDCHGDSPIHLSVVNGHVLVTQALLRSSRMLKHCLGVGTTLGDNLAKLLHIALLSGFSEICQVLIATKQVNLNYRDPTGETALYIASRSGSVNHVNLLIQSSFSDLDPNLAESSYGWTPLIVACVMDQAEIVKVLIDFGADETSADAYGWTAWEHTAFRGYWEISKLLQRSSAEPSLRIPKLPQLTTNALKPCSPTTTRVFVHLGAMNTRKPRPVVDLSPYLLNYPFNPFPEVRFSIQISGLGMDGPGGSMTLPVLDDTTNYPFIFHANTPESAKLLCRVFREDSTSASTVHIGTAVALLKELGDSIGPGRESLFRDHTIPIVGNETMDLIGTLTINFLVAKPCPDPRVTPAPTKQKWTTSGNTRLIGHRGLGMNSPNFKRLQIGENTIQSFKSTIDLGVSYIENLDVQLTRDHVPIIYHDFLVSESGADIATHNLSFDQFMCISDMQRPAITILDDDHAAAELRKLDKLVDPMSKPSRQRSLSFDVSEDTRTRDFLTRIKRTHEFNVKGFKGNIRGAHIHDSFTTLEDMLRTLPETVAFDIELKYPMLWEAEDWKMDLYGVELNLYADTILEKVYKYGGNRQIIFTSFSPELCILASHKQDTYPVMFLNESNLFPTGDVRASNLQEAIHFSRHWSLPGVVMSAEPFVASPKLVRFVKDAGLICASFGALNNDPENARVQVEAGLDGIIVDSVALIHHSFKESLAAASKERDESCGKEEEKT